MGQVNKARANVLANEILALDVLALRGNLNLQPTGPKTELHDRLAPLGLGVCVWTPFVTQAAGTGKLPDSSIVLLNLVEAGDTEVHAALANKCGDVGCWEEDKGDGEVLDERNVEAVLALELNVGALQKVETGLKQAALFESRLVAYIIKKAQPG